MTIRRALPLLLMVSLAGCTGVDAPCLPWDDGCATAALFAEEVLGSDDWDAVSVAEVGCDQEPALREDVGLDQCWRVGLNAIAGDERREVFVVQTTGGDLGLVEPAVNR